MGQKVNPCAFRLGITREWDSVFFAKRNYGDLLIQDLKIRQIINKDCSRAEVCRIEIKYLSNKMIVRLHVAKPGMVIGKSGLDIDRLRKKLFKLVNREVFIDVLEAKVDTSATWVASSVSKQLEKRVPFRQAMKKAIERCLNTGGVEGVKISCSGRLGGAEIARTEWYKEGRVPLHTLRANIDYGFTEAHTKYGVIGVKVIICNKSNIKRN